MSIKVKLTAFVICSGIVAKGFILGIAILLNELLGKHLFKQDLSEHLNSTSSAFIPTGDNFNFEWPWYYVLLVCFIFSVFWYFLGRVAFKKFGKPYWRYSLFAPAVYFMLSFDIASLFYMLVVAFGGFSAYSRSAPVSQAI